MSATDWQLLTLLSARAAGATIKNAAAMAGLRRSQGIGLLQRIEAQTDAVFGPVADDPDLGRMGPDWQERGLARQAERGAAS